MDQAGPGTASKPSPGDPADDYLPMFDLAPFLADGELSAQALSDCAAMAECLRETGCIVVRDPRVSVNDNQQFLDLMERYFGQPSSSKMSEARPSLHYQVGVTPSGIEVPKSLVDTRIQDQICRMPAEHRATMPTGADLKWRYMWRVGPRPQQTKFAELNAAPVIPQAFPEWQSVMDAWGTKLVAAAHTVAAMAALGFGLPADAFTSLMHCGPHLLAPTGSDLALHAKLGTVFAGFHYDLNFLTVHGKSRFPGLFVWRRDGRRVPVKVPDGCLLVQAGKQLEVLTGGHVQAGMHEVTVTSGTLSSLEAARAAGRSTWRVSSTVFAHIASDAVLEPLGLFATTAALRSYPAMQAGVQVQHELEAIELKPGGAVKDAGAAAAAKDSAAGGRDVPLRAVN